MPDTKPVPSTDLKPWQAVAPQLVDVAMGRQKADLVVRNGRWVNMHSGEVIPATDIAIVAGRFAYCGPDASHAIGEKTKVVDAMGRYLVPGLCDAHMHVESGMVTVTEFCRAVIPHGTTSMFIDPHEIANVLGLDGVRLMHDEAMAQAINVFVQMPSCVPSAPGLENAGAELSAEDVAEAMGWPNIIGLGEVMNFPGVAANDATMTGAIAATVAAGKTVGGHYASPDLGLPFHGYVAGGPEDDHEGTRAEDAIARVRQGMKAMLRLGSAWYDVASQIKAVTEQGLDPRNFILCTDDSHSGTLVNDGHMDRVVRGGRLEADIPAYDYPAKAKNTVRLGKSLAAQDFDIAAPEGANHVRARVIGVIENQAPTRALEAELGVEDGIVAMDRRNDVCQIALVERHRGTGNVTNGFVSGFGYMQDCAMASTVAHDSHHMIVVGTNKDDMAKAANRLGEVGGGVVLFSKGRELALVEMPIAGLMSDERAEVVAQKAAKLTDAMRDMGCTLNNAYMQHSLLALVVIPELRISDTGIIDVTSFQKVDLFL